VLDDLPLLMWLFGKAEVVGRITSDPADSRTEMGRRPQTGEFGTSISHSVMFARITRQPP
jgi:hypothetical protein